MGLFDTIRSKLVFPRREERPQFDNSLPSDAKTALREHAAFFFEDALHPQLPKLLKAIGGTQQPWGWEFTDGSRIQRDAMAGSVTATGPQVAAAAASPARKEPSLG